MDKQWKVVPVEITDKMHAMAVSTIQKCTGNDDFPQRVYAAMLAAAPPPPSASDEPPDWRTPENTGVGDWCTTGPAAIQRRAWLLRFDDADRGDNVYYDEADARRDFARAEGRGWNCHLFAVVPRAAPSPAASADEWMAEAERLTDEYADAERRWYVQQLTPSRIEARTAARAALLAHLKARP